MPPTSTETRAAEIAEYGSGSPMTPAERDGWRGFPAVDQEDADEVRAGALARVLHDARQGREGR